MKTILSLILLSLSLYSSDREGDREILHEKAGDEFVNFHFFRDGEGMTLTPNLSKFMWMLKPSLENKSQDKGLTERLGKIFGFTTIGTKFVGVFNVPYKKMDIGVLGCTACHSGKAAGVFVPGLGNKEIDPFRIGQNSIMVQSFWGRFGRSREFKRIHQNAMNFSKVTADKNIGNLTRGLVSDAIISTFFYKENGLKYPKMKRAQVKVPHLWGVKEKAKNGIFADGFLSGSKNYAWVFGAELFASDSSEHLRKSLPRITHLVDNVLGNLLPPKYPFKTNQELAAKGKVLFEKNCMSCHGDHERDQQGYPLYTAPKVVPIERVKTDPDRLHAYNPELVRLMKSISISDILYFNEENYRKGYFAPKLWGIWSRFPYLHNGSVPTIMALLTPEEQRPQAFSMKDAGEAYRFDKKNLGLTIHRPDHLLRKAKKGNRDIYYVKREGHSNQGHYFKKFDRLSMRDKLELIEYLKTL